MKKMNIKALLANHVEKIVFGVFGLVVLLILARTSWSRYPQTPDAMKQKVKEIRDKVSSEANIWPMVEQQAYKIIDFNDKARQLFAPMAPIALARYSFTPPLFHPLYRKDEPRREPTFETIQYVMAKPGLAPLSMINPEAIKLFQDSAPMVAMEDKPKMDDGEFAVQKKDPLQPGGNNPGRPVIQPPAKPPAAPAGRNPGAGPKPGGINILGDMPGMPGGKEKDETPRIAPVKALGVRFIAVRGVFPLAKQIENYKNALKTSHQDAQAKFEILDFVLERQKAVAGPDPWDENLSPWKVVDTEISKELLNDCSDFDTNDPVPVALRDAVITSPLPLRLIGAWTKTEYATHPKIKDLELKDDAIEQQNTMLESLDAAMSETQAAEADKPRRKGFSTLQRDVKGMVSAVRNAPGGMDAYRSQMAAMQQNYAKNDGGSAGPSSRPTMSPAMSSTPSMMRGNQDLERLLATSKYLLFRYFDFDVESGMAYRYRVRLKLGNPNYQLPPEELAGADPEIANGIDRTTPVSNISNAVVVDNTFNYFLRDIEREPYRDEKIKTSDPKPVALLDVFDWDTRFGTVVRDALNVPAIGAFIGGIAGAGTKKETAVLDLVEGQIEKKKEWKLTSLDVLVDVETDLDVPVDQHPELKLSQTPTKGMVRIGLNEGALIATSAGDLKLLDPIADRASEENWINRTNAERANFTEGSSSAKPKSRLGALANDVAPEEGQGKKGGKKVAKNPLRLGMPGMTPESSSRMPGQ